MEDDESDLRARAERWAREDPDPSTERELLAILAAPDLARTDLADRFASTLEFGTGGLRGVLGAGPNRMNRAVVIRTTWGLAEELWESGARAGERGVIVGYDARRLSWEFALDAALVLAARGIRIHLFERPVPTPLVAFAVAHLGALAGIMVTASHNPAEYNGYKVYGANGAQLIPPFDERVMARVDSAPGAAHVPRRRGTRRPRRTRLRYPPRCSRQGTVGDQSESAGQPVVVFAPATRTAPFALPESRAAITTGHDGSHCERKARNLRRRSVVPSLVEVLFAKLSSIS